MGLIDRQAAIDALDEQIEQCNKSLSSFDISMKDEYAVKVERASLVAFREILEYLPPAQLGTNLAEVGTDCISRQAAIDAVNGLTYPSSLMDVKRILIDLPPAEPQIIRCKDCKNWDTTWTNDFSPNYHYCPMVDVVRKEDWFCADAERKTE